jgi:hypothetical protein
LGSFAALVVSLSLAEPAAAGCRKSLTLREVPGGEPQPAHLIECDESQPPALLEQNAHLRMCDPAALANLGASFESCANAVDAARAGLRKAKIRAALQKGEDSDEAIAARYGVTEEEVDAQRSSVDLSGPIPSEATEEVAQ